jgi:hypothetical protein
MSETQNKQYAHGVTTIYIHSIQCDKFYIHKSHIFMYIHSYTHTHTHTHKYVHIYEDQDLSEMLSQDQYI